MPELEIENKKLKDKIKQLEYERELMKCCLNCKKHNIKKQHKDCKACWNYDKWQLKK